MAMPADNATLTNVMASLRKLVDKFDEEPLVNGRRIRDLFQNDPASFREAAVQVLHACTETKGWRYLVTLLWTNDLLVPIIADPNIPPGLGLRLAQRGAHIDPQLQIRLLKSAAEAPLQSDDFDERQVNHLLNILGAIEDTSGLQPFLRQMLLHPNARIRARISRLVTRDQAGIRLIEKLFRDEDARVRANAIEALWHIQNDRKVGLMREALADRNNRVVGNAILGLYHAGETSAVQAAVKMSEHREPVFRSTAAWVMGQTGDLRFIPVLGRLLADSDGVLRQTVFRALSKLKKASAAFGAEPSLPVALLDVKQVDVARLRVTFTTSAAVLKEHLTGTEVAVTVDGEFVYDYQLFEVRQDLISVAFILPRRLQLNAELSQAVDEALKSCLNQKRSQECWMVARCADGGPDALDEMFEFVGDTVNGIAPPVELSTAFTASSSALRSSIEAPLSRFDESFDVFATLRAVTAGLQPKRATHHIVVITDELCVAPAETIEEILTTASASKTAIHLISTRSNAALELLAECTNGYSRQVQTPSDMKRELELLYTSFGHQFLLDCNSPGGNVVRLSIRTAAGWGEGCWSSSLSSSYELDASSMAS